jgi:hypothetical protein
VSPKVFIVLGQAAAMLVEGGPFGHHEEFLDAFWMSSWMYIYQVTATDERSSRQLSRKTVRLLN